jgi:hypothetical protein
MAVEKKPPPKGLSILDRPLAKSAKGEVRSPQWTRRLTLLLGFSVCVCVSLCGARAVHSNSRW